MCVYIYICVCVFVCFYIYTCTYPLYHILTLHRGGIGMHYLGRGMFSGEGSTVQGFGKSGVQVLKFTSSFTVLIAFASVLDLRAQWRPGCLSGVCQISLSPQRSRSRCPPFG